jgi:hypothetical protein
LASRRRRRKTIGKVVSDVERRIRVVEKRPGAKRIKRNVVTAEKIQYRSIVAKNITPDAVTPNEVSFGTTVVADTEPTEYLKEGTTWVDPDTGAAKVYDPGNEVFVDLTATDAVARATADGKNTIYAQTTAPTGGTYAVDDLWYDTDDGNKLYRWTGTTWVSAQDTAIAAAADAAAAASAAAAAAASAATAAQTSADGKNKIYRQTTVPTGGTYAEGDTWFDTDGDNAIYRYSATTATSTVSNKALTLNVATLTTSAAHSFTPGESITVTGVDSTFNGTYTVIAVPTTTTLTYAKTASNVTAAASSGTITNTVGWKAITLGNNAITSISATKISTGTLAAGVVYAGSINTNQISAGTLAADVVYAGTIAADKITAGTFGANVVYAGTVNADKINAGSLAANVIYTGTINTSQLNAGTITASISMSAATITGGSISGVTITGGTIRTADLGARIEMSSASSNLISFWGAGAAQGALSVNDYRIFMYAPASSFGGGARIGVYGDLDPSVPNGIFMVGGTSNASQFTMSGTNVNMNQGTYGITATATGVRVTGEAPTTAYNLRNARITTSAITSGAASETTSGNIVLVREA